MERSRRTFDATTAKPIAPRAIGSAMARRTFLAGAAALVAAPILAAPQDKFDFRAMRPYWNEIPDSDLSKVFPTEAQLGSLGGNTGPASVVLAWGGAALVGDKLIIAAQGGHKDYFGNEVYEWWLSDQKWHRTRMPTSIVGTDAAGSYIMEKLPQDKGPNAPTSRHGYTGLCALGSKMYIGGVGSAPETGNGGSWIYDPADASYAPYPVRESRYAVYDAARGWVWTLDGSPVSLIASDADGNEKVHYRPNLGLTQYWFGVCDFDPDSKTIVVMYYGMIILFDVSDPAHIKEKGYAVNQQSLTATGSYAHQFQLLPQPAVVIDSKQQAGIAYHPPSKTFLCWGSGPDLFRFDHRALTIARITTPKGQPAPEALAGNGVFGRWRYMADVDAFIGFASPRSNMWIYKVPV